MSPRYPRTWAGGPVRVDLMRTVGWACSLLVVLALALFAYSSRTVKHHAGAGSPTYPGNGPLPRGGGRYVVGQPYQVDGRWYSPAEQPGYDEIGTASWYGPQFDRRQTANGEWFDMDYLTAAHTTLPLPSYVRVTNLENGRVLVVRLNDRGPFVGDRIIDLSRKAAETLSMKDQGIARVRVQYIRPAPLDDKGTDLAAMNGTTKRGPTEAKTPVLSTQKPVFAGVSLITDSVSNQSNRATFVIQVGCFENLPDADRTRSRFENMGAIEISTVVTDSDMLFQVRIGPLDDPVQARRALRDVIDAGYRDALLIESTNAQNRLCSQISSAG